MINVGTLTAISVASVALAATAPADARPIRPPAVKTCEVTYGVGKCPYFEPGYTCLQAKTGPDDCVDLWWAKCHRQLRRYSLINGRWVLSPKRRGCEDYNG